ncbi:restriction endonuclease subunit S [Paradesertivirga mongoliensis]|uniref:Restriction endonuclease subunit S n=1 Tax=Paradesertivirga mongoliensis TaxID=2100740 RepID=A0ABW4ZMI5_9SPHI|nr:restriction endonuclease subunit S [Pedobacter mongoliensis]
MSKVNALLPELRFPEFVLGEAWKSKKISELGDTISGLTGKSGEDFGEGMPFVTYKQVFDNSVIDYRDCGRVKIYTNENQNTLQRGDVLFTTSSETPNEVGFASVLVEVPKEPTYLNSFCFSLRPFNLDEIQPQFSRYLFHSPIYRKAITALAQGSTRYNISKGAFLNLTLSVPNSAEQQKIASCLSSLDELITAHSQKLELLKYYKKGLMQNLFPQEGEKAPKYRFSEFVQEWKKTALAEHVDLTSGYAFQSKFFSKQGKKLITPKNFTKEGKANFDKGNTKFTTEQFDPKHLCVPDDLLLLLTDLTPSCELLGKPILLTQEDGNVLLNQRIIKVTITSNLDKRFLLQYFLTSQFHRRIKSTASGSTVRHSSNKIILDTQLIIPNEFGEQEKIASCLSSLDNLILAQRAKIEQLHLHKKGLMQVLFPKLND